MVRWMVAAILFALVLPLVARADPCTARLPAPYARFEGPVRYVGDGDSLCVGPSRDPSTWIEVRLADFSAPELHDPGGRQAKAMLADLTFGRRLVCRAQKHSYDRVVAYCLLGSRSVGDLLRTRGGVEGGN